MASFKQRLQKLKERFWIWWFVLGREHLPEYYVDAAFVSYVNERLDELQQRYGQEVAFWIVSDLVSPAGSQSREMRSSQRENRDLRANG